MAAATLAGATGVIVATPAIASASVKASVSNPGNGAHLTQFVGEHATGFCQQVGAEAFVATCDVYNYDSGGNQLNHVSVPVGFHQNIVGWDMTIDTNTLGFHTIVVQVTGTGGGANNAVSSYTVDPAGPPPPPPVNPPSATITGPGAGTHVNPGNYLQLTGYCTPGDLPLANCYAQVWGPDGYHDLHAGDQLPTGTSGDYYVRLTASDGGTTAEQATDTSYHVNLPPFVGINSPSNGQVVNQGSTVAFNGGCGQGDASLTDCSGSITFPDGHLSGLLNPIPTTDPGRYTIEVHASDTNGLSAHTSVAYRVNALPQVFIDAPLYNERFYTGDAHQADYHCTDLESTPSCVGNVASGADVDTSVAGPKTFSVTATDSDGAVVQDSRPYTVYDRPVAHLDGPAVGTVINPGDAAPIFDGYCTGGMPPQTCTMTVQRPGGPLVTLNTGDTLPIDTYATYTMRVHIVDDIGTESEVIRTYKVNEPPHIIVDEPDANEDMFVGEDFTTDFHCYDNDGTVVVCDGAPVLAPITDTVGPHSFDLLATDNDGASTRMSVPYLVHPVVGPCRGRAISLLGVNAGDANPASNPCVTDSRTTTSLSSIIGAVAPPTGLLGRLLAPLNNTVKAGIAEGKTVRTAPATFSASADVASTSVSIVGALTLQVTGVHSEVTSTLTSCSTANRSGTSRIGTLTLNGVPIAIGEQQLTVPLVGLGTLYLNQRVVTQTGITERALFLDLAGTALDVVLGESIVNPFCG